MKMNILLEGIVGSTAYNLAHPGSDIDRKGIFACDTRDLIGLSRPSDTFEQHAPLPDLTRYEAAKWCNLALKCNPNILELVYLPEDLIEIKTDLGESLISIRSSFLSESAVKASYINYARSQLHQIEADGKFKRRPREKTEKHARHLVRLMMQGLELYSTGILTVRLDDTTASWVKYVGEETGAGNVELLKNVYDKYKENFDSCKSVLPDQPETTKVMRWLHEVRKRFFF